MSSEYLYKNKLFIYDYRNTVKIYDDEIERFNKSVENFKNFDYNIIKNNNIEDTHCANFIFHFIQYLTFIYRNLDIKLFSTSPNFEMLNFKGYDYNDIKKDINLIKNKEIVLITFSVHDGYYGHICGIYKENDKYWFCCCNKEIEVSYDDIINQNFQKIIDDWKSIREYETYNYKFEKINDFICISTF